MSDGTYHSLGIPQTAFEVSNFGSVPVANASASGNFLAGLSNNQLNGFTNPTGSWWDSANQFFGSDTFKGVTAGLGAAKGLADSWLAFQGLGLAQDQFDFKKDAFNRGFEAQRKLINTELEDRQRRRISASGTSPDGYRSVSDYMAANRV